MGMWESAPQTLTWRPKIDLKWCGPKLNQSDIFKFPVKNAKIGTIHTTGSKHETTNFRLISLISNIGKILEKVIHATTVDFLEDCKILEALQCGFWKGMETKDALATTITFLYKQIDSSNPTAAVFFDLSKDFDTVNHQILLE